LHIGAEKTICAPGRLVADEFLANRVRSGRKQPQRVLFGSP
jgi:hypothetical protein